MGNVDFAEAVLELGEVQAAARRLGLEVAPLEIRRAEDITPAFEALKGNADALYVAQDALVATNRARIITLALSAQQPTIFGTRDFVQAGALMSYGPNFPDQFRRAAELVDKILRGAKPADLPVEQPTKFELVINLTTAKALGITVPASLFARADEVIE
jgi:putative ABC transport system substrate-binding protein